MLRDEAPALRDATRSLLLHKRALSSLVDDNENALAFLLSEAGDQNDLYSTVVATLDDGVLGAILLLLLRHEAKIKFFLGLLAERERQVPHARRLEELLPRDEARRLGGERVEVRRAEVAARDALRRVLVDALGQGLGAAHHPGAAVVEDVTCARINR